MSRTRDRSSSINAPRFNLIDPELRSQCLNATPVKKHSSKFRTSLNQIPSMARICSAPLNYASSSEKLKNGSGKSQKLIHAAKSRSSSSDRFSRFRAFSTFSGVSLTRYGFDLFALPSKILVVAKRDLLLPLKLSRLAVLASRAISLWLGRKANKGQSFHQ